MIKSKDIAHKKIMGRKYKDQAMTFFLKRFGFKHDGGQCRGFCAL